MFKTSLFFLCLEINCLKHLLTVPIPNSKNKILKDVRSHYPFTLG